MNTKLKWLSICLVSGLSVLTITGCGNDQNKKTIEGLKEQNDGQRDRIEALKSENQGDRQASADRVEQLKRDYEGRIVSIQELHRKELAQLQGKIASLQMELGAIQREKLALQEMVDREERIPGAKQAIREYDILVVGVLVAIPCAILVIVVQKLRSTQDRLNLLVMQRTSELRRIGAKL